MEIFDDGSGMSVNYENLINSREYLAVTRKLASDLLKKSYMTVGQFISNLSDGDISQLLETSVDDDDEDADPFDSISETERNLGDLLLIAEMLAVAEGLPNSDGYDMVQSRVSQLIAFLAVESLARKGLVKSHPHNMSFGDDMAKKIIAERIDDESDDYQE
jgi:hypothetical protein